MDAETQEKKPDLPLVHWAEIGMQFASGWGVRGGSSSCVWSWVPTKEDGTKDITNLDYVHLTMQAAIVAQLVELKGAIERLTETVSSELSTVRRQNAAIDRKERERVIAVLERISVRSIP